MSVMGFRGGIALGRTTATVLLLVVGVGRSLQVHADGAAFGSNPGSAFAGSQQVSIWDRPVSGTDMTYGELTVERRGDEEDIEPILLPLPAPALAAGVGLGIAYLVRYRLSRR